MTDAILPMSNKGEAVTELKSSATFTWESSNEFIAQLEKMTTEVRECIRVLDQTAEDVTDLVAQRNALREVLEPVEEFLVQASDIYRTLDYAWVAATAKFCFLVCGRRWLGSRQQLVPPATAAARSRIAATRAQDMARSLLSAASARGGGGYEPGAPQLR
jgi:hypothetical protein